MQPQPAGPLGPPPFRFEPSRTPAVSGPAFSLAFKFLITVVVAGCAAWGVRLWLQGKLGQGFNTGAAWFAAALAMMAWTWWASMRSITSIGRDELRQSWVWTKKMPVGELAYARLVRVRGLEWLIAPRLYVRTLVGKFTVFYVADKRLVAESERLVAELKAFRDFR